MDAQKDAFRDPQSKPLGQLLADAAGDMADIVRKEVRLAQTEIRENAQKLLAGAVEAVLGAVILIPAITLALLALAAGLYEADLLPMWGALLVSTLIAAGVGAFLLAKAKKAMSATSLKPTRAAENIKADVQVLKERT